MAHLTDSQLGALRRYDTPTIANAIETFDVRLRNVGFTRSAVRCLNPTPAPMVGYAFTVRMKSSSPPTEARLYVDRSDWWELLEKLPAPRVLVIQDVDDEPGQSALFGSTHASIWMALQCIGAVTDGAIRDLPALQKANFGVFAKGLIPSHGFAHIVEVGEPVVVHGMKVEHGDLLHGDIHGVVNVPLQVAGAIPAAADSLLQVEQKVSDLCVSPDFSLPKLRELLRTHF